MIQIKDLSYSRSGKTILSRFSFQVQAGEKVLIQGRSGSGKTSLFKLILGFEPPDAGQIIVNVRPLDKENITGVRQDLFYLSQDVDLPDLTGQDLIAASLKHNQGGAQEKKPEILDLRC